MRQERALSYKHSDVIEKVDCREEFRTHLTKASNWSKFNYCSVMRNLASPDKKRFLVAEPLLLEGIVSFRQACMTSDEVS
jgi:hypothetical protein